MSRSTLSRLEILAKSVYNWFAVLGVKGRGGGACIKKKGCVSYEPWSWRLCKEVGEEERPFRLSVPNEYLQAK